MIIRIFCALALVCAAYAQTHIVTSQSTATGSAIDHAAGATTKPIVSVTVEPSGACTEKDAMVLYQTAGASQPYACNPADGNACPCTWVKAPVPGTGGGTGSEMLYTTSGTGPGSTACTPGRDVWIQTGLLNNGTRNWGCGSVSGVWVRQPTMLTGADAPVSTACDQADERGDIYIRNNGTQPNTTVYICGASGVGAYSWELLAATPVSYNFGGTTAQASFSGGFHLTLRDSWVAPASDTTVINHQHMPFAGVADQVQVILDCATAAVNVTNAAIIVRKNGADAQFISDPNFTETADITYTHAIAIPFVAGDRFNFAVEVNAVSTPATDCRINAVLRVRPQ